MPIFKKNEKGPLIEVPRNINKLPVHAENPDEVKEKLTEVVRAMSGQELSADTSKGGTVFSELENDPQLADMFQKLKIEAANDSRRRLADLGKERDILRKKYSDIIGNNPEKFAEQPKELFAAVTMLDSRLANLMNENQDEIDKMDKNKVAALNEEARDIDEKIKRIEKILSGRKLTKAQEDEVKIKYGFKEPEEFEAGVA